MASLMGSSMTGRVSVSINGKDISGALTNVVATQSGYDSAYVYQSSFPITYTVEFIADGNAVLKEKGSDVDVIDALFTLKPRLKKKYKGNREAFRKDLLAAAEHKREIDAVLKLDDLLGIES